MKRDSKWDSIRKEIVDCKSEAFRNSSGIKWPVLFERSESSLYNIRAIFVSQEVAFYCRSKCESGDSVRSLLIDVCKDRNHKDRSGRTNLVSEISRLSLCKNEQFNPEKDYIYWTHALKCVPACSDKDIHKEWKFCAPFCVEILKREIDSIPSEKIALIAIGGWALAMCLSAIGPISERSKGVQTLKITDHIAENSLPLTRGKVDLYAYIHPSHREQVISLIENGNKKKMIPNPDKAQRIRSSIENQDEHIRKFVYFTNGTHP